MKEFTAPVKETDNETIKNNGRNWLIWRKNKLANRRNRNKMSYQSKRKNRRLAK